MKKTSNSLETETTCRKPFLPNILIGLILRQHREQCSLTQEYVAEKAGCHASYLSTIENGKAYLSIRVLFELCKALKISPSDLIEEADQVEESYLNSDLVRSGSAEPENPLTAQHWLHEYTRKRQLVTIR